jgi:hypothetical protein
MSLYIYAIRVLSSSTTTKVLVDENLIYAGTGISCDWIGSRCAVSHSKVLFWGFYYIHLKESYLHLNKGCSSCT